MNNVGRQIFNYQWGDAPPYFAGRQEEESEIRRTLGSGRNAVLIVGRRGVGKTSLIRRVLESVRAEGWIVEPDAWALPPNRSITPVDAAIMVMDAAETYRRKTAPHPAPARRPIGFQATRPDTVSSASDEEDGWSLDIPRVERRAIMERLGTPETARLVANGLAELVTATEEHPGLVVVLDEFQMYGGKGSASPIGMISTLIANCRERHIPCRFILAGMPIALDYLQRELGGGIDLIKTIELGHLTDLEATQAMEIPLRDEGITFEPSLVQAIVRDTCGHPKLLQFFAQSVLNMCKEGNRYTLDQYMEVLDEIEARFGRDNYPELPRKPDKLLEVLWAAARTIAWKARVETKHPELVWISPGEIRSFYKITPSNLSHFLEKLMQPDEEYVYKAGRARYGFLKPLLWKSVLRLKGEGLMRDRFHGKRQIDLDPDKLGDPVKARKMLRDFIEKATLHCQRVFFVDEYLRSSCVEDYLSVVHEMADIYVLTRFEEVKADGKRTLSELAKLRASRKGSLFLKNYQGPSSAFPIKGRFIIAGPTIGIHSSQSFADLGKRKCVITRMRPNEIQSLLRDLEDIIPGMSEIRAPA
jgi:hypothetical protein